jgi:RND family efflux transporter MFP subunit
LNYQSAQIIPGIRHEEMVASQTGFSSSLINFERAKLNLSYCEMKAPFAGTVGDVIVQAGQFVASGQECLKLMDMSRIRVYVGVLESEIQHVKVGRAASIQLPAFPGETFNGKIITINPLVDPENKTCRVTVEIDNPDNKIKGGMFAYVKLDAQIFQERLLVPRTAILTRDQRNLIFIVRENDAHEKLAKWDYVETGLENEEFVEILNSKMALQPGEWVITSGHYTLAHDAEVRVVSQDK